MTLDLSDIRKAWTTELRMYPWDLWVTLTFELDGISEGAAFDRFTRFCFVLGREVYRTHLRIACASDPQPNRYPPTRHYHALIGRVDPQDRAVLAHDVVRLWRRYGNAKAEEYIEHLGGAEYLAKHADPEIAVVCPNDNCSRRRRCPVARTGWLGSTRGYQRPAKRRQPCPNPKKRPTTRLRKRHI